MKLLVATEFPPDAPGGGPAVVRQMLQGFPGEVHWWSVRGSVLGASFLVPSSSSSVDIEGLRSKIEGRGARVEGFQVSSFHSCPPGKLMPARKLPRIRAFLMEHLWAPKAARSLRQAIENVKPDCVWVIPHDWSIFPIAKVFANDESRMTDGKKPRFHVTIQDYPDAHFHGRVWGEARVQRMAWMQEALYARATTRDATSLPMLDDLERRTGKRGIQMLHQGLESQDFSYLESLIRNPSSIIPQQSAINNRQSEIINIAYAGTILCEPEFALFVNLLDSLIRHPSSVINHSPSAIELHIFGAHSYADRPWFRPWIIEHGNFPERELLTELRKCDWGFIPMSLEGKDPRYNRFSFPTKFITYLAAGLPTITIGHSESSVMKMATAYNVGITIQSRNPSLEDLAKALFSPDSKQAHLPEILRCSREQFDAEAMRAKLWGALASQNDR